MIVTSTDLNQALSNKLLK